MYRIEKLVEGLLSMLRGTELWDCVPTVIPLAEKVMASIVRNIQAENGKATTRNLTRNAVCFVIQLHNLFSSI